MTTVYLFPGQGADERLFSKIKPGSNFRMVHVNYPVPEKGATMADYAGIICRQIDTTGKYILIGVSLGGMICSELADILKPEKIIIVSSAKNRHELPMRYKFKNIKWLHSITPKRLIKWGAQVLQPIVEPDRNKSKDIFKSMLGSKSPIYYKRTVNMIINWQREHYNDDIIHIHGTDDRTLPIINVKAHFKIDKGSHVMTLTRGDELNEIILSILNSVKEG